ncbi:threonine synthase [Halorientalis brevis]|uniref:Threonine synthase n=1 Tax=Halorientalis brevis TaxID=1126241 RepID=A0ABD6CBT8_9EURY|nr:threonine synthase [Halorientalis brevis]
MNISSAVHELVCTDCAATFDPADQTHRCPDCDGFLTVDYDLDAVDVTPETLTARRFDGVERYAELLPFEREALVSTDEGTTPLVECPTLAEELGVGRVLVKDEGRNPTGSVADRGLALAVAAARAHDASDVALPTTGNAGQSAAAYAGRAGLASHSFVPSRATFGNKAMINVHGGDMSVVGGRYDDAAEAFADAIADEDWYSVAAFETPYRVEGQKTLAYELAEQLDWDAPDAVVYPTGQGVGLVGLQRGAKELAELGLIDDTPALYAAQAEGCAPIVEAVEEDRDEHEPTEVPDTICGDIEIADPAGGSLVLEAIRESDGGAVAADDKDVLESAVTVAQDEGVEMGASSGAAASGAAALADAGEFDADDTVVLVNTAAADKEADVLRSHLMSKGI